MFAQDRLSLFIGRANKYAAVELSDYRKRLCVEYNISNQLLDDYYRRCGSNWGNVGLALEIAKTSGRHMREVCDYYKRYPPEWLESYIGRDRHKTRVDVL